MFEDIIIKQGREKSKTDKIYNSEKLVKKIVDQGKSWMIYSSGIKKYFNICQSDILLLVF